LVTGFATAPGLNLPDRIQAFVEIPLAPERGRVPVNLQLRRDLQFALPAAASRRIRERKATCCGVN
jgi:hypothetical protein